MHQDSAQTLNDLIERLLGSLRNPFGDGNQIAVHPLHKTFEKISEDLGYENYIEFVGYFLNICNRVQQDLQLIAFRREEVRNRYGKTISIISSVFDASNFETATAAVFQKHFSQLNRDILIEISDRYEGEALKEASVEDLQNAFADVKDLSKLAEDCDLLSEKMRRLIDIHINHLHSLIGHYDTVGEADFWNHYKILFATFSQLIGALDEKDAPTYGEKLRKVLNHIVVGTSLTADVVTIGAPITRLLGE